MHVITYRAALSNNFYLSCRNVAFKNFIYFYRVRCVNPIVGGVPEGGLAKNLSLKDACGGLNPLSERHFIQHALGERVGSKQ